jgi:CRP-like cAMP-binding protein
MAAGPMRKTNCAVCEVSAGCPFAHLHCEERSPPNSLLRHQSYAKGERIFRQGAAISGLYVLCAGKVKLAHQTKVQKQIVRFLQPGEFFGEAGLTEAKVSSVSAKALMGSTVGQLSPGDLQELLKRDPALALEILKRFARQTEETYLRLAEQAHLGTHERLIRLILALGTKYGCRSERGLVIDLPLTQMEIAEMLGDTREWVCKKLGILQKRGLISYRRGELVILDEAGLRQLIAPPVKRLSASGAAEPRSVK